LTKTTEQKIAHFITVKANPSLHDGNRRRRFTILVSAMGILMSLTAQADLDGELLAHFVAQPSLTSLPAENIGENIVSADIIRGPGLIPVDDFAGFYDSSDWSTASGFPGVSDGSYLEIEIAVDPGFQVELDTIGLAYSDAGSRDAAQRLELRHSGDNFNSVLFKDTSVAVFPEIDTNTIDLTSIGQTFTDSFALRLYGYGAIDKDGILGFANDPAFTEADENGAVLLTGEVAPIPEPAHLRLLFALVALAFAGTRRRGFGSWRRGPSGR
jgi:hypothetical protein